MAISLATMVPALLAAATWIPDSSATGQIFQGNSIMIVPSKTSHHPADASFTASNFYCYFTPRGYLSFGWYVLADKYRAKASIPTHEIGPNRVLFY